MLDNGALSRAGLVLVSKKADNNTTKVKTNWTKGVTYRVQNMCHLKYTKLIRITR
jgi:hypothetical protein